MHNQKGMTLIEVLISLVLFTVISVALMRIASTTFKYQKKITKNIRNTKLSRKALQILKKDIRNIFYTQDTNALTHIKFTQKKNNNTNTNKDQFRVNSLAIMPIPRDIHAQQLEEFENKNITPYLFTKPYYSGGILGKQNSLSMNSFSYVRTTENENMSDQNIIIYYLKSCKNIKTKKPYNSCLWRKSSPLINQDMENLIDYNEFVLLEDVNTFKLSYYNLSSSDWLQEWKIANGEKNRLPSAIKIKLEFKNHKQQQIKKTMIIPLYHQFILPEVK